MLFVLIGLGRRTMTAAVKKNRSLGETVVHFLVGLANVIVGLLFLLVFGPPTFLNRHLLQRARRITPDQPEPPLRWIQVNAIVAAWTGALVAFVLLVLHALGGNGAVLGWLAVLTGIYVLVVMGFNPRLIGGIVLVLIVLVLGLLVALILEKEGQNYPLVEWFLWLIFRTGMDFYPFPTAMLGGGSHLGGGGCGLSAPLVSELRRCQSFQHVFHVGSAQDPASRRLHAAR